MKKLFTTLSVLLIAAATMAQVPSYVPTNGLVGYWPFNGNANDESGNGNNGTVNGATLTTDRNGNSNSAYDFDGVNDYIVVPDVPMFSFGIEDFTVCYWVNRSDSTNSGSSSNLYDNGMDVCKMTQTNQNGNNEWLVGLSGPQIGGNPNISNRLRFSVESGTTPYNLEGQTDMNQFLQTWIFVTAKRDGDSTFIFLNGAIEASRFIGGVALNDNSSPLFFAAFSENNSTLRTEAIVDDIGIWNRALSACEIEQLYLGQVIPQPSAAVTTSGSTTFCQGGSVTLSVPQADDYLWSNGATSQSITVNSTGTYNVTVTNGNSCSETSQNINVTVNSLPNVSLGSFSSICDNAPSVSLAGGSPSGGSYTVNGTPSTELNPSVTGSGMQNVAYEYTDNNGCSNTATQTVMVNQSPSVSLSGLNTAYTPTDPAVQLNGTPSGGVYSGSGVTNDGVFDPAVAGIGTHNVQYVYVDGNGCIGVDGLCTSVDMSMNIGGSNIDTDGGTFDVYPNPSNGNFTVSVADIEGVINLSVFDARGREVFTTAMVGNGQKTIQNIDLSNYANGVFTLSIRTAKGIASQKLIKE